MNAPALRRASSTMASRIRSCLISASPSISTTSFRPLLPVLTMLSHNLSTARPSRGAGRKRGGPAPSWNRFQPDGDAAAHPPLQHTLRKFYLKVHPDLFTHYPTQKHVNQESFSRFQAFLDDVRDKNTAPPRAGLHAYRFYLKTKDDGLFQEVALELRTTGGDCRNVVQRSLEGFFTQCGLPEKFIWAEGDWNYNIEVMSEEERQKQEQEG